MTSLGFLHYSEINDSSAINSNLTDIEKKKQTRHNITIKKKITPDTGTTTSNPGSSENVQNMLKLINNSNGYENDNENDEYSGLADFNPPPRAEVSSKTVEEDIAIPTIKNMTIDYEKPTIMPKQTRGDENTIAKPRQYPVPLDSYEGFNALPKTYASDYYKQYVPYFNQTGSGSGDQVANVSKNQLLEKLNYMIHLLEEQKDEKTGHVMEEVILYSFLGVFIIFIVDSFARVGKYTR
jgi:hypothetical protein